MFQIVHPHATDEIFQSWNSAEKVLRSLELLTRVPGHIAPVAAPVTRYDEILIAGRIGR